MTLCEDNCEFKEYDFINKRAKCSCEIIIDFSSIEDIKIDYEKLKKNFVDINNVANIKFMKCYKLVFKKENIKYNLGFYILIFIFGLFLSCLFLFYFRYYNVFFKEIEKLFSESKDNNSLEPLNTSGKNKIKKKKKKK